MDELWAYIILKNTSKGYIDRTMNSNTRKGIIFQKKKKKGKGIKDIIKGTM